MNPNVSISPITLHLVEDEEQYEEHPKVGIVARATITVSADPDGLSGTTELCTLEVESRGVWGIECPDLAAGHPIPKGSWIIGDFGNDQIDEVHAALRALLPDNPTPTEKRN